MAKSRDYWQKRFTMLADAEMSKGEAYYKDLERIYRDTLRAIEKDITYWFVRFADNNEITLADAKKWIKGADLEEFKWDVHEYIRRGEEYGINAAWAKELENASARVHISRLESIKLQTQQHVEMLYGQQIEGIERLAKEIYHSAYYHTAYEVQVGYGVGYSLHSIDKRQLSMMVSKPWTADGATFSTRIWRAKDELVNMLHKELTQATIRGESLNNVIAKISKQFDVSTKNAGRLVMTESAFFASAGQQQAFKELDVERYEIVSALDHRTSAICRQLDGKVLPMSDYAPGITAPPFHAWCRTVTVPYFDDNYGERAVSRGNNSDPDDVYYVPSNMTYNEWFRIFGVKQQ